MIHLGFLLILMGAAALPAFRARRAAGVAATASGLALAALGGAAAPPTRRAHDVPVPTPPRQVFRGPAAGARFFPLAGENP